MDDQLHSKLFNMVYELLHRSCLRGPEVIHYQDQCQQIKKMGKNLSSLWDVGEYQFVRLPPQQDITILILVAYME